MQYLYKSHILCIMYTNAVLNILVGDKLVNVFNKKL